MSDQAKRTYRPRKQIHEYAEEVAQLRLDLNDCRRDLEMEKGLRTAQAIFIDMPTVRFALGLLWKAMTHAN